MNRENLTRMLRNANDIELIGANTAFSQNSLFYKEAQMYFSIPSEVRNVSEERISLNMIC